MKNLLIWVLLNILVCSCYAENKMIVDSVIDINYKLMVQQEVVDSIQQDCIIKHKILELDVSKEKLKCQKAIFNSFIFGFVAILFFTTTILFLILFLIAKNKLKKKLK